MTRPTLLLSIGLSTALLASSVHADTRPADYHANASKEEAVGFFSGALLGGLVGGPPGAMLGAAIGAFAGDGQLARQQTGELKAELLTAQIETDRLRKQTRELEQQYQVAMAELDQLRAGSARTLPAFLPGPIDSAPIGGAALSVHFRTGSSAIESHYQTQLESIARLATQLPTAAVEITGYADRNGDAEKNLHLSRERSNAVKTFLNEHGIENASITTVGFGENDPLYSTQTMETDFFDRRVTVRIRDTRESMLTQTPDGE